MRCGTAALEAGADTVVDSVGVAPTPLYSSIGASTRSAVEAGWLSDDRLTTIGTTVGIAVAVATETVTTDVEGSGSGSGSGTGTVVVQTDAGAVTATTLSA